MLEGYLVDDRSRIVGEVRRYDPYSNRGEVMFYEMDTFGFIHGYLRDNWTVMSKEDLQNDKELKKKLEIAEYEMWKRHNLPELKERYGNFRVKFGEFEDYCKRTYRNRNSGD